MRKQKIIWLLIISFVAIAVFGFVGMGHDAGHNDNRGCLATTATGGNCPRESAPLGDFNFYLTVFRSFSLATLTTSDVALVLFALLLALAYGLLSSHRQALAPTPTLERARRGMTPLSCQWRLRRWLALRQRGDAALVF